MEFQYILHKYSESCKNNHNITISRTATKNGGILSAFLAAIPTTASVIGGVTGLTSFG
jgi:hypothetical protein